MSESSVSPIEKALELSRVLTKGPNVFSATQNPSWHPPGARSIYGGTIIAQSIVAAHFTLHSPSFRVHSMHCYFIRGGTTDEVVFYHVDTTSDGRSFAKRTVQARQNGVVIATAIVSFTLPSVDKKEHLRHCSPLPAIASCGGQRAEIPGSMGNPVEIQSGPEEALQSCAIRTLNYCSPVSSAPYHKRQYCWMRAVGPITAPAGHSVHQNALAYLSDRYLFGTVARAYGLSNFGSPEASFSMQTTIYGRRGYAKEAIDQNTENSETLHVTNMLSLDHTMYFHTTDGYQADKWLLFEMQTPWADEERALVFQRIFTSDGLLVATCVQEGMMRVNRTSDQKAGLEKQEQTISDSDLRSANESKI